MPEWNGNSGCRERLLALSNLQFCSWRLFMAAVAIVA
jgi:hypothetical protein